MTKYDICVDILLALPPERLTKIRNLLRLSINGRFLEYVSDDKWIDVPEPVRSMLIELPEAGPRARFSSLARAIAALSKNEENEQPANIVQLVLLALGKTRLETRLWRGDPGPDGAIPLMLSVGNCCAVIYPDGFAHWANTPSTARPEIVAAVETIAKSLSPEANLDDIEK